MCLFCYQQTPQAQGGQNNGNNCQGDCHSNIYKAIDGGLSREPNFSVDSRVVTEKRHQIGFTEAWSCIYMSFNWVIIGLDKGLAPSRWPDILYIKNIFAFWFKFHWSLFPRIPLLMGFLETKSEIWTKMQKYSIEKMYLKVLLSARCYLGLHHHHFSLMEK